MALRLSRKHHAQLLEWAKAAGNSECCGLLLGTDDRVCALEQATNVAIDISRHFEIDPATLIRTHRQARTGGLPVMGCFHSHPNGLARPSAEDSEQAAEDAGYWLIIATGKITAWQPSRRDSGMTKFEPIALIVEG